MSSIQANAAKEILRGVYEALGDREPNESTRRYIHELREQVASDNGPNCRCGAHNHGGDCMCNE